MLRLSDIHGIDDNILRQLEADIEKLNNLRMVVKAQTAPAIQSTQTKTEAAVRSAAQVRGEAIATPHPAAPPDSVNSAPGLAAFVQGNSFRNTIKEYADNNMWTIFDLSDAHATLKFETISGHEFQVGISQVESTLEFWVSSSLKIACQQEFGPLASQLLRRNAELGIGFWCLAEADDRNLYLGCKHNAEMKLLNSKHFGDIVNALLEECNNFEDVLEKDSSKPARAARLSFKEPFQQWHTLSPVQKRKTTSLATLFKGSPIENTIKTCAAQNKWHTAEINDERAVLKLEIDSGRTRMLYITRFESTLEFLAPTNIAVATEDDFPCDLAADLLERNAESKKGFWCLRELEGKNLSLGYMYNTEIELLNSEHFVEIVGKLLEESDAFADILK